MAPTTRQFLLIADDFDDAASLLASLLEAVSNYETAYAKDGEQALQVAEARLPDVCILDIDMPRIDGMEAARRLHDRFGDRCPMLIAMTGGHRLTEAADSGLFQHTLLKPVDLLQLLDALGEPAPALAKPAPSERRHR